MNLAFFYQTTENIKNASFLTKLYWSEFWATIQWLFVIPSIKVAMTFLTLPQINLSSYIFTFISQIFTNKYWLKIPLTIDDWSSMIVIMLAIYISSYKVFG
jgi:hypothetical protein